MSDSLSLVIALDTGEISHTVLLLPAVARRRL